MVNKGWAVAATAFLLWFGSSANAQCPEIGFIQCDSQSNGILVSWNPPANSYANLNLLRDGQVVATLDGQSLSHFDSPPGPGVYLYQVTADCGATSFFCSGQVGVLATYTADQVSGVPGSTVDVQVRASTQDCDGVMGGSFGLRYDPSVLTITETFVSGSLANLNFNAGPGLQSTNLNPAAPPGMVGVTFAFVADITPPIDQVVPVGMAEGILTLRCEINPNATIGQVSPLEFTDVLGSPSVAVTLVVEDLGLAPTMPPEDGSVTILDTVVNLFVRGDANSDGILGVIDGILVLSYLFLGDDIGCLNSADFTDDGVLSILDGILLLEYLFLGGTAPPAPFPSCGMDPTSGSLDCNAASSCL